MAVESTMLELGTQAPDFELPATDGRVVRLGDFADRPALLVMFISNHCPYVKHLKSALAALGREYSDRGLGIAAINSNDPEQYPDDSPAEMARDRQDYGYSFPYLFDETQEVASVYRAACTPDFFLFNEQRELAYRGQFDDSRPGNGRPVTGGDLRGAIDAVLAGRPVASEQTPSVGCSIKWRPGNEPAYER
ncbi:MAG: redoxin domain-containing protein [Gemmatimonas sp.]|nr:redoxin domain-containing protein [Gemmatimonas sp.]